MSRYLLLVLVSWIENKLELPTSTLPKAWLQGSHCSCWAHVRAGVSEDSDSTSASRGKNRIDPIFPKSEVWKQTQKCIASHLGTRRGVGRGAILVFRTFSERSEEHTS